MRTHLITLVLCCALAGCQTTTPPSEPELTPYVPTAADLAGYAMWEAMEERYLGADRPSDPIDGLYWLAISCGFWASEMSGDRKVDDSIALAMKEDGCDRQIKLAQDLRLANLGDRERVARIDEFIRLRRW